MTCIVLYQILQPTLANPTPRFNLADLLRDSKSKYILTNSKVFFTICKTSLPGKDMEVTMILVHLKSHQREKAMRGIFALSQFSLAAVLVGPRLSLAWVPGWFPLDFVFGLFTGLSLVGNIASLIYFNRRFSVQEGGTR